MNGFVIILIIMIFLAITIFNTNDNAFLTSNQTVSKQLNKINLTQQLFTSIAERTRLIQSILLKGNSSPQTEGWQLIGQFDQSYSNIKNQLLPLLSAQEREKSIEIDKLNVDIADLYRQVSALFQNGSQHEATRILLEQVLPKTESQLDKVSELAAIHYDSASEVLLLASQTADANRSRFTFYAVCSILASLIIAALAIYHAQRLSGQLENMSDYLEEIVSERTESLLDTQKELLEDNNELSRLASTDALTGLFNRNHMNDILEKEHSRYLRYGHFFGIILIDIDHFKQINDTHGHDVGDQVLTRMAQQLKSAIRNSDFIGRWGGEEFLICCTAIETDDIRSIAENIRNSIAHTEFDVIDRLTISLGCAIIQQEESIFSLIKRSDIALYQAKNNGRNQTIISTMES